MIKPDSKPWLPEAVVTIINVRSNETIKTVPILYKGKPFGLSGGGDFLAYSADGNVLAVGSNSDGTPGALITLLDVKSSKVVSEFTVDLGGEVMDLCFTPDGSSLIGGVQGKPPNRSLMVWDLKQNKAKYALPGCKGVIHAIACSPTKDIVAAGGGHHGALLAYPQLLVWNWRTGTRITSLAGHRKTVLAVAFSPNGRLMASGDFDGEIRIWETVSWKEVTWLKAHKQPIDRISFSTDGNRMLTIGGGKVKAWDLVKLVRAPKRKSQ
jgi:WD40 repeat protein